jgi:hypothetical protein
VHKARIERTGQAVFAYEIDRQPPWRGEDLVCWELDCGSPVREVGGYTKRDGTPYKAYFRLKTNVEHQAGCPLNPVEVITSIAQGSEGLATVDKGVLRLTLPQDLAGPGVERPGLDGTTPDGEVVDRRIKTVLPLLPPLVNSAVKIVRFLVAHDFDDKVVNRFKVLPYGRKRPIAWPEFCETSLLTVTCNARSLALSAGMFGTSSKKPCSAASAASMAGLSAAISSPMRRPSAIKPGRSSPEALGISLAFWLRFSCNS